MGEDLLFAKISEPEMTVINFDDHFRDRMGEVDSGHIEVFPKLWNLSLHDKTNEITRIPRLMAAYHKVREETKGWGDYRKLPEEIPEFPLISRCCSEQSPQCEPLGWETLRLTKGEWRNSLKQWTRILWAEMPQCCSIRSMLTRMKQLGDE